MFYSILIIIAMKNTMAKNLGILVQKIYFSL